MKFGKVLIIATAFASTLVGALPTVHDDSVQVVTRDAPTFNFPLAVRTMKELNDKAGTPEGLDKRDDEFINSLLELLHNNNLLNTFVDHLTNNSAISGFLASAATHAISNNLVNSSTLVSALSRSGLLSNVFNSMLESRDLAPTVMEHTRDLFKIGLVDLDGTSEFKREDINYDELSDISKRDVADFIVQIINAISNSGLVSRLLNSILSNPTFLQAGERLLVRLLKEIDWSSVIKSIWNSGIIQNVFKDIIGRFTSSSKRDYLSTEQAQLLSALSSSLKLKVRDGAIKREEVTGNSNLASLAQAALSSSTTAAPSTKASTTTTSTKAASSGNLIASLIDGIFDGNNKTTTSTKAVTTTTKHSSSASSTHTGFIEEIIDDLFGKKNSTKTTTTTTSRSTSTGSVLLEILDDIFHPSNSTSNHTSTSGGEILEDVLGLAERGIAALFKGGRNSTGSRILHAGLDLVGDIVSDLFGDLFHKRSTNSTSSGGKSLLTEIFDDLFNENTLKFILRVVEWIFDALFDKPKTTTPSTSSRGAGASATSTGVLSTATSTEEYICTGTSRKKRSGPERLKRKIKREITKAFIKRSSIADTEDEINQLAKSLL